MRCVLAVWFPALVLPCGTSYLSVVLLKYCELIVVLCVLCLCCLYCPSVDLPVLLSLFICSRSPLVFACLCDFAVALPCWLHFSCADCAVHFRLGGHLCELCLFACSVFLCVCPLAYMPYCVCQHPHDVFFCCLPHRVTLFTFHTSLHVVLFAIVSLPMPPESLYVTKRAS